jgi:hypothetical protein
MFMTYLHTICHSPSSYGSLHISMKPEAKRRFHMGAILLICVVQKRELKECMLLEDIS